MIHVAYICASAWLHCISRTYWHYMQIPDIHSACHRVHTQVGVSPRTIRFERSAAALPQQQHGQPKNSSAEAVTAEQGGTVATGGRESLPVTYIRLPEPVRFTTARSS